jgi:hypothetical protein
MQHPGAKSGPYSLPGAGWCIHLLYSLIYICSWKYCRGYPGGVRQLVVQIKS